MLLEPDLYRPQISLSSVCKIGTGLICAMDKYGQFLQPKHMDDLPDINGTRSSSQAQAAHQELLRRPDICHGSRISFDMLKSLRKAKGVLLFGNNKFKALKTKFPKP